MEVVKIRLQAQNATNTAPRYRNAALAFATIIRDEGFATLYRGAGLTALRQGSNQAACFSAYTYLNVVVLQSQNIEPQEPVSFWQTTLVGLTAGTIGPLLNAPVDTLKTRIQTAMRGGGNDKGVIGFARDIYRQEGIRAFYKGLTPRLMRVAPGQAVTFTVYEYIKGKISSGQISMKRLQEAEFDKL
ncbi:mitochondrial carrier domain-containing protein [Xylariales sp. PMI_506]|nr:mitochondrial carrier domain-containing protein [Xylariales sp. PMI_506]